MGYQTITVDLVAEDDGTPDRVLNELAADGWVVHTVHEASTTTFKALMERVSRVSNKTQPGRAATGSR